VRVDVGGESEIPEGGSTCVSGAGRPLALFKIGGKVYCLDNDCTHLGGPLCEGVLDGFVVECPWHGSRFDVRTGEVVGPPAETSVESHPVRTEGGRVWVDLP
jgi:nitrite reductase/ring-hydroxylating ferredoxin subunit